MLGSTGCFRAHQLIVELDCDPAGDLILQREQIAHVTVEPLGPEMRIGLGVDQLGVDADLIS